VSIERPEGLKGSYSVQNPIPVAEFQSTERHGHPALDIGGQEDERPVFDNVFKVGVQEFEDEVEVRFMGEDVY
jgi:hypothetical protein